MFFINSKSIYFTIFMHILSYHKTHTMSSFLLQYPKLFSQINEKNNSTELSVNAVISYYCIKFNDLITTIVYRSKRLQLISKTTSSRCMHLSISSLFFPLTGSPEKKYSVLPFMPLPLSHLVKRFT